MSLQIPDSSTDTLAMSLAAAYTLRAHGLNDPCADLQTPPLTESFSNDSGQ